MPVGWRIEKVEKFNGSRSNTSDLRAAVEPNDAVNSVSTAAWRRTALTFYLMAFLLVQLSFHDKSSERRSSDEAEMRQTRRICRKFVER
jgi:uncharacterized membrane protein YidH (DUF202 family)